MPQNQNDETRDAAHGERMIEVKVRFWTNSLRGKGSKKIRPKHALTAGVVRIKRNDAHGIREVKPIPFHSLMDVSAAIEKALMRAGIRLHPGETMRKYLDLQIVE